MINQQLVDYIKQQLQAGVTKEVVLKALGDAGWPVADVDDSMKAAVPASGPAVGSSASAQATVNPAIAMGGVDMTGAAAKSSAGGASMGTSSSDKFFAKPSAAAAQMSHDDEDDVHPSTKKFVIMMIVMGLVILLLAGALAFVYFNLNSQLSAAQQGGAGNSGQVATLQGQVNQLNVDKETLTSQMTALTAERDGLVGEVSFFVPATGTSTAPVSATVKGMLSGSASTTFALTTAHNIRILVANSKDAKVSAALTPLLNSTSTVTLSGTHAPASINLTVTAVNGAAL